MNLHLRQLYPPFEEYVRGHGFDVDVAFGAANVFSASVAVGNLMEERVLRAAGLTLAGWRLLLTLRLGGPNEPRNLSRILFLTRPSVVNGLNTLERGGLVVRRPSKVDRRLVTATVTPAGAALFDQVAPRWFETVEAVMQDLDPDNRRLLSELAGHVAVSAERLLREDRGEAETGAFAGDADEGDS